ncbi:MAG: TadE/TadG family type IV pilus assembly protein [Acidimicrobiales bacterium]
MTEAALVSPLFFALLFGVIEMGILFRDHLTITNATRDGARTAAASGNDIDADWRILQTINQSAAAADRADIQRIVIFKATSTSDRPSATCKAGTSVDGVCNVYTVADLARPVTDFTCAASSPDKRFCPYGPISPAGPPYYRDTRMSALGYVGVYVEMRHRYVTGFFGASVMIRDTSVVRIEPRTSV